MTDPLTEDAQKAGESSESAEPRATAEPPARDEAPIAPQKDAPPPPPPPGEPPLAPDVPRLARPGGTAKQIPETILGPRPSPMFLAVVSIASLVSDIVTKLWAEKHLE